MMLLGGLLFSVGFITGVRLNGFGGEQVPQSHEKQPARASILWEGKDHISGFFRHVQLPEYENLARNNG